MKDYYLSVAEVAKQNNVTTKTVYEWIKKGLKTKQEHVSGFKYRQVIWSANLREFIKGATNND